MAPGPYLAGAPVLGNLALVMIVRNEAHCIQRCLRSAAAHVDRMLVVDTGSQDKTVALARGCGAEVHQIAWPESFALARNHALTLADADWNLVLDADEWIVSGGESLRLLVSGLDGPGVLRIDSNTDTAQAGVTSDWITRLLPRGVRYEGAVHEQPVCAQPRSRVPVVIGHDGYLGNALQAKRGRNRAMLLAALQASGGGDPYLLFQLGKDFETYGELSPAADHYLQSLALAEAGARFRPQLIVRAMHCLGKSGRLSEAMTLASDAMEDLGHSPDYQFTLGDLCLDGALARPHEALDQWLPLAEAAWLRCLAIGECPEQDGRVAGRGSYLAAHNLHAIYDGLGDQERSTNYRQLSERLRSSAVTAAH